MKKILITWLLLVFGYLSFGQTSEIEGVIRLADNSPAVGATVSLSGTNITIQTDENGTFVFKNLKAGSYQIIVVMQGYETYFSDFLKVSDNSINAVAQIKLNAIDVGQGSGVSVINADDLNNEQGSENVSALLHGSRDVFLNSASYSLGPMRFRIRGYDSEFTEISINGVDMKNMENGRTYWSVWGGLNNVTKYKNITFGLDAADNTFGNIGGVTDITMRPTKFRKGLQLTYSMTNRSYRNRAIVTYNSGLLKNNWAFSFSGSRRWADEGYVEGTFYDAWGYYIGIEKQLPKHTLVLNVFGAPSKRGKQGASVQEMYDLTGNVYYNPYWGYQNGKKRNSRVASMHLPTAMFTDYWKITNSLSLQSSLAVRFGRNGATALNWYSAPDPRPDYYRNLPSYITNDESAEEVANSLSNPNDINYAQINWAALYYTNENSYGVVEDVDGVAGKTVSGKMGQYMIEDRRYDQFYANFSTMLTKYFSDQNKLDVGFNQKYFVGKNFKEVNDLLGADYWLDIDKYAERDLAESENAEQSNILQPNHVVYEGDVFGYNYNANVRETKLWSQYSLDLKRFNAYLGGYVSYTTTFRDGKMKNGKFPDSSYGKSKKNNFFDYGAKIGLLYKINGRNFLYAHGAYLTLAPTFRNSYISPRTRDNVIDNLSSQKITSTDIGYSYRAARLKVSLKAFYTKFMNQTKIMSFYHDGYRNFVNYAMHGIDKTHQGIEMAVDGEIFTGFSAYGVTSLGYYRWTSRPTVSVTVDNSAEVLADNKPVYAKNFLVSGTPQTAASVGLRYKTGSYWFFNVNANYVDHIFLSFNPERRTADAVPYEYQGSALWNSIINQERLPKGYTLDLSIGKSFRFDYKYYLNFNLSVNNVLNNKKIITGGYEQLRYDVEDKNPDKFPPKYYYLYGRQFYLNVSFRF